MKILQSDVNKIQWELVKPEAAAYEKDAEKKGSVEEALVLFVAVEKGDSEAIASEAVKDAVEFAGKLKRKILVVYPFAHLSSNLEEVNRAMALFKYMVKEAEKSKIKVVHSAFGWNKAFSIDVKGHPMAEMYRSYPREYKEKGHPEKESNEPQERKDEQVSASIKEEEKVVSKWYILDPKQGLIEVHKYDFTGHENLKKFADYEIKKVRAYLHEPPHVQLMKKLQLVDYEPGSDPGNLRFYPNGRVIKTLLEKYVTQRVIEYGAVEVETPVMYDYQHPALKEYLERFPSRHYLVTSEEKEYFLRFAACFGQFLMMHDATLTYKNLPFKVYELARYAFRREKSGEVAGMRRLRAFTMPDMHTLCSDLKQAEDEFDRQFKFCQSVMAGIGFGKHNYEAVFRFTEAFWRDNKDFILRIVSDYLKKPALVETWSFRYAYFDPKFEFNIIDSMSKATSLSTVQIDHENGARYDLKYVDNENRKKTPVILHCSPSGAIERVLYALLEFAAMKQAEGATPMLPLWLCPTQVRLLPLSDKYDEKCIELAEKFKEKHIRVDIDDNNSTLGKKIGSAESEWIPYICVVGEKEIASGRLSVRVRETKEQSQATLEALIDEIEKKLGEMPRTPLTVPMLLSKRPTFTG